MEREALFHLISENAADMIAVVDMEGRRIYNSLSYQSVLGYSPEELQAFGLRADSPRGSRARRKSGGRGAAAGALRRWNIAFATRMETSCLSSQRPA